MTDRDDRQSDDRLHPSNSPSDDAGSVEVRPGEASVHHDRTDPEVPSAKRKGARQRRGTLVALSALVGGLLTVALSLLYRASEKVSETANGHLSSSLNRIGNPGPIGVSAESLLSMNERGRDQHPQDQHSLLPTDDTPDASRLPAAATSSQAKGVPADGIIRSPAF